MNFIYMHENSAGHVAINYGCANQLNQVTEAPHWFWPQRICQTDSRLNDMMNTFMSIYICFFFLYANEPREQRRQISNFEHQ